MKNVYFSICLTMIVVNCIFYSIVNAETAVDSFDLKDITLSSCFDAARTKNVKIKSAYAAVLETEALETTVRSRWLPQVFSTIKAGWAGSTDSNNYVHEQKGSLVDLSISQHIVEFGPTQETEYARLTNKRQQLYAYEDQILEILSEVRKTYYLLYIAQKQRFQHDSLLGVYKTQLEQAKSRLESGVGVKNAVLTAQLNILEERERILELSKKERLLVNLLAQLIGIKRFAVIPQLAVVQDTVLLDEDSCVVLAMKNDTRIADSRYEAVLYQRRLWETNWEFLPEMTISAGVAKGNTSAQFRLFQNQSNSKKRWAIDVIGNQTLISADTTAPMLLLNDKPLFPIIDPKFHYTAAMAIELPIFRGLKGVGAHRQAMARYEQSRMDILIRTQEKEQRVREAYAEYKASLERLSIQEERVSISRERYVFAEMQRDLGRMNEDGFDAFRTGLFNAQDNFFEEQFRTLEASEYLRKEVRLLN